VYVYNAELNYESCVAEGCEIKIASVISGTLKDWTGGR